MWRRLGTLRARTTLLAAAVTGVTLVAGAVLLLLTLRAQLTESGDALARSRVQDLLASAASGVLPRTLDNITDESVAQVIDDEGRVVAASPNIEDGPRLTDVDPGDRMRVMTLVGPDDAESELYRIWIASGPSPDGEVTVVVGTSLESVAEATRTLGGALLVGVPLVLLLLAAVTWAVVGRALGRIDQITTTVATIGEADLHRRVPAQAVNDEVGRLATTMNRMLDRLETASTRQRRFVADASHDLQSPLTSQRAQLEVALAHPDRHDLAVLCRELLANSTEMEQLVSDLLYLVAEDEGGGPPPELLPLDLDDIVLEETARVRATARVSIDTTAVSAAPVLGNAAQLRRLVRNIVDNAVRHAVDKVQVGLSSQDDLVLLDVVDDGPGVSATDRERVFDRFFRGDSARTRGAGTGLGLAIARAVAENHDGDLVLLESSVGAHFQLRLPAITRR